MWIWIGLTAGFILLNNGFNWLAAVVVVICILCQLYGKLPEQYRLPAIGATFVFVGLFYTGMLTTVGVIIVEFILIAKAIYNCQHVKDMKNSVRNIQNQAEQFIIKKEMNISDSNSGMDLRDQFPGSQWTTYTRKNEEERKAFSTDDWLRDIIHRYMVSNRKTIQK